MSSKSNLFDPDGHRRILIYRKHTVPFITVAHLRVILTFGLMRTMCWIFLVLNLSLLVLPPVLTSGSVSEVHNGTNCYLLFFFFKPHSCSETKAEP